MSHEIFSLRTCQTIILVFVFLFLSYISNATAQSSPFPAPIPCDTRFVVDRGDDLDTDCKFYDYGSLEFNINVTRYVGPVNAQGYLLDAEGLIENRIVPRFAYLIMPVFDVDDDCKPDDFCECEKDSVYFYTAPH